MFGSSENQHTLTENSDFEMFYQIIFETKTFLNSQLNLAIGYNILAIPIMAGALWFIFMPGPLVGATLMNIFSIGLIYRSEALRAQIEKAIDPRSANQVEPPNSNIKETPACYYPTGTGQSCMV